MKTVYPTEQEECERLAAYLEELKLQGKVLTYSHTAQETYTKSWKQKRKNKRAGVNPGVPDYIITTPTKVIFLEMKRQKGGVTSEYQKEWLKATDKKKTVSAVAKGFDEAKKYLQEALWEK